MAVVVVEVVDGVDQVLEEVDRIMDEAKNLQEWFVTTVEVRDTKHQCAHLRYKVKDVVEVATIVAVPKAEVGDGKHGMQAWQQAIVVGRLFPKQQHPLSSRETPEASERSACAADEACGPEPSKPLWRGSREWRRRKDLNEKEA